MAILIENRVEEVQVRFSARKFDETRPPGLINADTVVITFNDTPDRLVLNSYDTQALLNALCEAGFVKIKESE